MRAGSGSDRAILDEWRLQDIAHVKGPFVQEVIVYIVASCTVNGATSLNCIIRHLSVIATWRKVAKLSCNVRH